MNFLLILTHFDFLLAEPHNEELVESPIERGVMRKLLQEGKKLLNVHDDQFEDSVRHQIVKKALTEAYSPENRAIKSIPLAGERYKANKNYVVWSGAGTVLGDYIFAKDSQGRDRFRLLSEVLVVKLISDQNAPGKVTNALVRNLRTGNERTISAKVSLSNSLNYGNSPHLAIRLSSSHAALFVPLNCSGIVIFDTRPWAVTLLIRATHFARYVSAYSLIF